MGAAKDDHVKRRNDHCDTLSAISKDRVGPWVGSGSAPHPQAGQAFSLVPDLAAFAAAFCSCLYARTRPSDSGSTTSATDL